MSVFLRGTVFRVDNWDDRIYFYERDIPGSFTVPAYYGRGYSVAAVGSSRWGRLTASMRLGLTDYPSMRDTKQGKAEVRLQLSFSL